MGQEAGGKTRDTMNKDRIEGRARSEFSASSLPVGC
jgi:hypothetical protein